MAGDDLDVFRQIFFEGSYFDLFTRCLASDNGALLGCCINISMRVVELGWEEYKVHIGSQFGQWLLLQRYTG